MEWYTCSTRAVPRIATMGNRERQRRCETQSAKVDCCGAAKRKLGSILYRNQPRLRRSVPPDNKPLLPLSASLH
ncbi:hypothetical protein Y032_0089g2270 [Ancylostoma ceylanicum]|uniref:Uncharacterized protein n=1 Tax=Ancylostoma ceylanicum TaxID=53326 RepID=A0A016TNZ4_9BILA|nr:hypothetical protein Y032_0089g2270 [Ancylostoma ceylanicum]